MDIVNVIAFATVASLLVMSPGPNGVLIAKTVPIAGRSAGLANVAGFIVAFYLHGALSIFGISAILMASSKAFFIVKMLGAVYLCWLGVKALREALRSQVPVQQVQAAKRPHSLVSAFLEGLLTNALNPKVSIFYLAAFPQFMATSESAAASAFVLVTIHATINAAWFSAMVFLFARLVRVTRDGYFQRWLKGVTGVVFVGFGIRLATYRQ